MAIGDRVRAAEELKAERELNDAGKLSGRQLKELVAKGLSLSDARELAASGIPYEQIAEIADAQAAATAKVSQGGDFSALAQQFAAVTEHAIATARNRIKESFNGDVPHKGISIYNPDGLADPPPPLKCKIHEGFWDEKEQKAIPRWEMEGCVDGLGPNTKLEVLLANRLEPGEFMVRNHDGVEGKVRVVAKKNDATGALESLIIAYPHNWVDKPSKGKLKPNLFRVFADVYGTPGEKPEHLVAWLKAQQETVAV